MSKYYANIDLQSSTLNESKGADIASATTTNIGAATGNFVVITGTTTITGFGTIQAGTKRTLQFNGVLTLTHNATSLILPTGANIDTAAGDTAELVSLGSGNWKCTVYQRADGTPLAGGGGGGGDVTAASNLGNNLLIRGDGSGKGIQNSGITIDDSDNVTGVASFTSTGVNISDLTAQELVITDGSKNLVSASVATYPSLTELTYLKGVTSAIQGQINAKGSGTVTSVGTASGAFINGSGGPITTSGSLTFDLSATGVPSSSNFLRGDNTWASVPDIQIGDTIASSTIDSILFVNDSNQLGEDVNLTWDGATFNVGGNITLSGTVDGIDIFTDVTANNAKVTNATHTGEVTGSGALTVGPTAISNKATVTLAGTEEVLVNDAGTLKKTTTQDIADLGGGGGTSLQLFKELASSPTITTPVVNNEVNIGENDVVHLTATGDVGINVQNPRVSVPSGVSNIAATKQFAITGDTASGQVVFSVTNQARTAGVQISAKNNNGDVYFDNLWNGAANSISFRVGTLGTGAGTTVLQLFGNGEIGLPNLPTSAPATSGRIWNDSGTLKIS